MGNPITAPLVDARELLQQTWDVMEIGKESPVLEGDTLKAIQPGWPFLLAEIQARIADETERLITQNNEERGAASRPCATCMNLPETLN
jgi:hypothetical protein